MTFNKMKSFIKIIMILIVFSFLLLKTSKGVLACADDCTFAKCDFDTNCYDCSYCLGGGPTDEPTENTTGNIVNPILPNNLQTMPGGVFLGKFIRTGIGLAFLIGIVIFFFILTSGGIKWLSSSGDKTHLESAQKQITSALVGLAILLTTFAIIQLIETIFGVSLLNITLPTL